MYLSADDILGVIVMLAFFAALTYQIGRMRGRISVLAEQDEQERARRLASAGQPPNTLAQ